jgi:hypothetical protein
MSIVTPVGAGGLTSAVGGDGLVDIVLVALGVAVEAGEAAAAEGLGDGPPDVEAVAPGVAVAADGAPDALVDGVDGVAAPQAPSTTARMITVTDVRRIDVPPPRTPSQYPVTGVSW